MEVNIFSSGRRILKSGCFITFNEESSIILIQKHSEKISFEFKFVDKSNSQPKLEINNSKNQEEDHVKTIFTLTNFNDTLGRGLIKPISFAKFNNGDIVYIHFWIKKVGESPSKEINYTIYLEENK